MLSCVLALFRVVVGHWVEAVGRRLGRSIVRQAAWAPIYGDVITCAVGLSLIQTCIRAGVVVR